VNNDQAQGSKFLKGAAVLSLAALISKVLGSLFKIPFQNIAGDSSFGIYNMVYPIYVLILIVSSAGLPITVSKFVSERAVVGDIYGARRVLKISMSIMTLIGVIFFLFLYFGAEAISVWIKDKETVLAIKSVSFALIVVPVMAAIRGYFQGLQDMVPTAISQVIEQIIRVITMLLVSFWLVQRGFSDAWLAAGATFGAVTGSVAGLIVMFYYWYKHNKKVKIQPVKVENQTSSLTLTKQIILYAFPILLGSIVLPILNIVDTFTIPRFLQVAGQTEAGARELFGLYNHGLTLVQLVSMVASSLSVAIVPSISEAMAKGQLSVVKARTNLAMRFTLLISLPASMGLALLATPINTFLFASGRGSDTLAILAFTTLFSTLNIISTGVLQGLGKTSVPAKNLFIAAITKTILNMILVTIWGINGAAIASVASFGLAAILNMISIYRHTGVSFSFKTFVYKPMQSTLAMAVILIVIKESFLWTLGDVITSERILYTLITLIAIFIGMFVYAITLFKFEVIKRSNLEVFPSISNRIIPFLEKTKILPKKVQEN